MPNWTTNEVRFTFDMSHQKQKFLDFVKSDDNPFDFNKIIPMPEVFNRLCTNGTVANKICWCDDNGALITGELSQTALIMLLAQTLMKTK